MCESRLFLLSTLIIYPAMKQNIGYLLSDSARLLRRTFDQRVRSLGLTAVQARLLLVLDKVPDENQAFYAERIEVEPITLTRIVDRLEEAGWVTRIADPADRRARLLHPTDKSREILEPLRVKVEGLVSDMAADLSTEETAMLADLLGRVAANLEASKILAEAANG